MKLNNLLRACALTAYAICLLRITQYVTASIKTMHDATARKEPATPFRMVPSWFQLHNNSNDDTGRPDVHLIVAHYLAPTEYVGTSGVHVALTIRHFQLKGSMFGTKQQQLFSLHRTRRAELYYCFQRQLASRAIDHIHIFYESKEAKQLMHKEHPKVTPHMIDHRMTFADAFRFANQRLPRKIIVFANADIYFDDTLQLVRNFNWEVKGRKRSKHIMLSISRYEDQGLGYFESIKVSKYKGSHDTFVWTTPFVRMSPSLTRQLTYPLGKAGSENRLMYIMTKSANHIVLNPAYSISTWHIHNSNERTYDIKDRVDMRHGPFFMIAPIALNETHFSNK